MTGLLSRQSTELPEQGQLQAFGMGMLGALFINDSGGGGGACPMTAAAHPVCPHPTPAKTAPPNSLGQGPYFARSSALLWCLEMLMIMKCGKYTG